MQDSQLPSVQQGMPSDPVQGQVTHPSIPAIPTDAAQLQITEDRPMAAMNAVVSQAAQGDSLNPQYPMPTAKEQRPITVEYSGEMPSGMQSVETLRTPEIGPEIEKYIEEVKESPDQLPHEVVVAGQKVVMPAQGFVAQPVVVLPMTQKEFDESGKASPDESKRWLHVWTEKIIKMFAGSVTFRSGL
jgi:hypothetical protein